MTRRLPVAAALALVLALVAALPAQARVRLQAFTSCANFRSYAKSYAPKSLPVTRGAVPLSAPLTESGGSDGAASDAAPAPSKSTEGTTTTDTSTTNVQEAGIDEPDIVKTDGKYVYAVESGALNVTDVTGDPKVIARLPIGGISGAQLFLSGDTLLVAGTANDYYYGGGYDYRTHKRAAFPYQSGPQTLLATVDVKDRAHPAVVGREAVDGSFVDGRQNGRTARVVVSAPSQAPDYMPDAVVQSHGKKVKKGGVVHCRSVRRPHQFTGSGMLTILTVDLAKGLPAVDADSLFTAGDTVYASANNLYVATRKYVSPALQSRGYDPNGMRTEIHRFDISNPDATVYKDSGSVPGYLLNNFAMSEDQGVLRVASTDDPPWNEGAQKAQSSQVTTLKSNGSALAQVGQVSDLGPNQKIYAVRMIGDVGYVVTFRQIDPLYTIDLSDPAKPKVLGQLELEGYSAYLHPVGDGLILGIGRDVTAQGAPTGVAMSLFDVSDLAHPKLVAHQSLGDDTYSTVDDDYHAFLWWPKTNLAVVPVNGYRSFEDVAAPTVGGQPTATPTPSTQAPSQPFTGAIGFNVTAAGIKEVGRVSHDKVAAGQYSIDRSLVAANRLFTVSQAGILQSPLDTLAAGPSATWGANTGAEIFPWTAPKQPVGPITPEAQGGGGPN